MYFSFDEKIRDRHPLIVGIINLNSDSFYKGARGDSEPEPLRLAEQMVQDGADILDIGAESSRPGAKPIAEKDEIGMLLPVVKELSRCYKVPVSVDTYKAGVAERVLDSGAVLINDITGLRGQTEMAGVIARYHAGVILMHMQGSPDNMQENPSYANLIDEIADFLEGSVAIAEQAGISSEKIAIDPGIGFGKTVEHNLEILARLDSFKKIGKPILVGASRKSFIGHVLDLPVEERLEGSLAASVAAVLKGADLLRVHDVKETARAVKIAFAIKEFESKS